MSAVTGPDGTYAMKLRSGAYVVAVSVPEGYENPGPVPITVLPGQTVTVDFKLTRKSRITGIVVDDADEPISGVTVTVAPP